MPHTAGDGNWSVSVRWDRACTATCFGRVRRLPPGRWLPRPICAAIRSSWKPICGPGASNVTQVLGFNVPQLLGYDADLLVLEMTVVQQPVVLDFAEVRLDFPLALSICNNAMVVAPYNLIRSTSSRVISSVVRS